MAVAASVADERLRSTRASLDTLQALVGNDLSAVNRVIVDRMQSPVALIPQLAGHIVSSGGKRLRPMLTLISARLCGYSGTRHIPLAACVEFIHTATLLHDDVVDASVLRRGSDTANALWGNEASVLVGDFLFSRAFQVMVEDGSLEVLAILSNASAVIAEGEVMQLVTSNDTETNEADYLAVVTAKTAKLFSAACQIGAVVADRPDADAMALAEYGLNFGISFQLVDDALDYSAAQATLGKTVGDDFREGKLTLPVVFAYARGDAEERKFWRRTLERGEQTESDLETAIGLMAKHNALADTIARARQYGDAAHASLARFADSAEKRALHEAIAFCIERAY
ncbi:MAG: polyprenyl synthetase family protein [Alphaproteobacteria bacterium]|nr:polyprenyl synthetase family protein [Alphaproteobacteria bacterium]MDP6515133.1 polyprenyl synthetase family protein [Alphaproteobacteria bacterium]